MKHIIIIALSLLVIVGCKKEKPERQVTFSTSQVKHGVDSLVYDNHIEIINVRQGDVFKRQVEAKNYPTGLKDVQVSVLVESKEDGFSQLLYDETKQSHNINVAIP